MINKGIVATLFIAHLTIFNTATADEFSPPPAGVVVQDPGQSSAGIVPIDDGMEPDPLPLAPSTAETPPAPSANPVKPTTETVTPVTEPVKPAAPIKPTSPPSSIKPQNNSMLEKCKIKDKDGNGLIKAYMADSGPNLEGDANAWIWVPRGQCKKLNQGDYSGVDSAISGKINPSNVVNAKTLN